MNWKFGCSAVWLLTCVFVGHEADRFDGAELAELALQLLFRRVIAQAPHEQRLERVALRVRVHMVCNNCGEMALRIKCYTTLS